MQEPSIAEQRELSQIDRGLLKDINALAAKCGDMCAVLRHLEATDSRWVSIGTTDIQKGFMSLVRSVTKPSTF